MTRLFTSPLYALAVAFALLLGTAQPASSTTALPQTRLPVLDVTDVRLFSYRFATGEMQPEKLNGTGFRSLFAISDVFTDPTDRSFVVAVRFSVHGRKPTRTQLPSHDRIDVALNDAAYRRLGELTFNETQELQVRIDQAATTVLRHHAWALIPVATRCETARLDLSHRGRLLKKIQLKILCKE